MESPRETLSALPRDSAAKMRPESALLAFATSAEGLKDEEARRRLERFGPNELAVKKTTAWDVLARQCKSPMIYLLGAAAVVSFGLGEWIDGLTVTVILLINTGIGFFQEYRSEQAIEKLRERLAPRARVRREGAIMTIERKALVPGDLVLLAPGDIVPADLRVILARRLTLDESALTGESIAVQKTSEAEMNAPAERAHDMAMMLTRVVAGSGEGLVVATGTATVIGRIAKLTSETPRLSTFERDIRSFSNFLLKTVLVILAVVLGVNVFLKGESQLVPQFLFAVALAVSVIPEALPAIVSVTLSRGALVLAKSHVVVKRLAAIEDLGQIEVLCTDKTGTITEGIMSVDGISAADSAQCLQWALGTGDEEELRQPAHTPKTFIAAIVAKTGPQAAEAALQWRRLWFTPFDPSRRRATAVFDDGKGPLLVILGAPEETISRSTLSPAMAQAEKDAFKKEGLAGRRVLALAVRRVGEKAAYDDSDEQGLTYVGRIAFVDPVKSTAKQAVADAKFLHVTVKIITGDSPEVAGAVALETGVIESHEEVVSGEDLDAAVDGEFHRLVIERHVFARVTPEQKFRIIQALERDFNVGFLGEGINDAPALKAANVALAVDGASDVAREAADIILMKSDLHVIIDGIRQGRAIFTNVIKYVKYTLIGNFGNFLAIAGVSLMLDQVPMLPVQILLTNLLTDLPLITVAADNVGDAEVASPKRFNLRELAFVGLFLGLVSSLFDFSFFALNRGEGLAAMRTLWFQFSVITELVLIYSIRTRGPFWKASRPATMMIVLCAVTTGITLWIVHTGFGAEVFRFIRPDGRQIRNMLALCLAYFVATEAVKLSYYKVFKPGADGGV